VGLLDAYNWLRDRADARIRAVARQNALQECWDTIDRETRAMGLHPSSWQQSELRGLIRARDAIRTLMQT
jgi:hypothetical protein